ncbi:MAG: PAAR domain-containing protein [Chitinophagaceae bacterium]
MSFAARVGDNHSCPLSNPGSGNPHTGGLITGPGVSKVLIGKKPAAVIGDKCTCVGPVDSIATGSTTVKIGGQYAARMDDMTQHGGKITSGFAKVIIGG